MFKYLLCSKQASQNTIALLQLWTRIIVGMLILNHGIEKWMAFSSLSETFPDPLWLGSTISLVLVIFAEVFCAFAFIFGVFFRLALIPLIISMSVASFIIHGGMPLASKELALIYLIIFVMSFIAGPGRYSVDHLIVRRCRGKEDCKEDERHENDCFSACK